MWKERLSRQARPLITPDAEQRSASERQLMLKLSTWLENEMIRMQLEARGKRYITWHNICECWSPTRIQCWYMLVHSWFYSFPYCLLVDQSFVLSQSSSFPQLLPLSLYHIHYVCGGGTVCPGAVTPAIALVRCSCPSPVVPSSACRNNKCVKDACVRFVQ